MKRRSQRGTALVEVTLMVPWILFLFVGILDFGFYSYAAINTQNAARAAAIQIANNQYIFETTNNNSNTVVALDMACRAALQEMRGLPNMIGVNLNGPCAANAGAISDTMPVAVRVFKLCAASSTDPTCTSTACADCALNSNAQSAIAEVTYRSLPMVPIPGLLMGQLQLTRFGEARIHIR